MGIIRKQALWNSIFAYAGVGLGYINLILLFPAFFTPEQFGLIQLLISISEIFALISAFGLSNSITRFFPFYKTEDKKHGGFLIYVFLIAFSGYAVVAILYLLFKPLIISAYIENSSSFTDYYYIIIPFSLFTLLFTLFEIIARVIFRTIFPTFIREVLLRILTTFGIVLFITGLLDFHGFIIFYILIFLICVIAMLVQILISNEFSFKFYFSEIKLGKLKELLIYGSYSLITGAAMQTGVRIHALMIGSMVGLSMVGVYNLYYYLGSIIYIPTRAMSKIAVPIIATAFKNNTLDQINDLYKRTSIIQLIFGLLIYLAIIINRYNFFYFLKNPVYTQNFVFFIIIGIGILVDIIAGLNGEIIVNSPKYKYNTIFTIVLILSGIVANLLLIPVYGAIGAAYAFVLSYLIFNIFRWVFLAVKYKMQPINYKQLLIIFIATFSYLVSDNIPFILNVYADIFVRSLILIIIFLILTIILKISEDINERFRVYRKKLFNF